MAHCALTSGILAICFFFNLVIIWLFVFFNLVICFFFNLVIIWLFGFFYLVVCFFFNLVIWLFGFFNLVMCFFNVVFRFGFAKSQEVGGQAVEPQT